ETINEVSPLNFKVAYSFAAIPARIVLENKNWQAAASLQVRTTSFPWKDFPWQEAIIHFTKAMGNIHIGQMDKARAELAILNQLRDTLEKQKDPYKTKQVEVQIKTCTAWLLFKTGNKEEAWQLMKLAADMEDSTGKHPVTPGEVIPARELLGDMLLEINQNEEALQAYENVLGKSPNRFNALSGAGRAAERSGNDPKAIVYYKQLLAITENVNTDRPELAAIRLFVKNH
ncbi:MAG: tetratricopeptide repeat protein, partial [Chitinophagaceae bacterium]|nr:tetratricopeptide repeat protein [Chitinophagaceae bacterium]